ncbi:MAG: hypothetical protein QM744_02135 [Mesorhizobium sp.]
MADKGTGKSTTAATLVSKGHALLSDDLVAIEFDGAGQPFIIPSFPRLKLAARVCGFACLGEPMTGENCRISGAEAEAPI